MSSSSLLAVAAVSGAIDLCTGLFCASLNDDRLAFFDSSVTVSLAVVTLLLSVSSNFISPTRDDDLLLLLGLVLLGVICSDDG